MLYIDVDLLRRERGPQKALLTRLQRYARKGQPWARTIYAHEILLACPDRENSIVGQKHTREPGIGSIFSEVSKLGRVAGYVIDDEISHHFELFAKRADVSPIAEPRVDSSVIDRVEPSVRAVDRDKKGSR